MSAMNPFGQIFWRGRMLYEQNRYALAESEFRQALVLHPDSAETHAMVALCLHYQGRFPQAKNEAEESIRLAPDRAFTHHTLSVVLSRGFNFARSKLNDLTLDDRVPFEVQPLIHNTSSTQAVKAVEEAVRLEPENPDYLAPLARLRIWSGKFQDGLAVAEQGLARNPAHPGCLHARILALAGLRQTAEVQEAVKQFRSLHPEHPLGPNLMGQLKLHSRQPQAAQEQFLESLRINPESSSVQNSLALAKHTEMLAENLEIMRGTKPPPTLTPEGPRGQTPGIKTNAPGRYPKWLLFCFVILLGVLIFYWLIHPLLFQRKVP